MCKLTIFALALFIAVVSGEPTAADISNETRVKLLFKIFEAGTECSKDYPLSDEDANVFKELDFPEGDDAKCYAACLFKKVGAINEKGLFSVEDSLARASKVIDNKQELEALGKFLESCSDVNNEDVSDGEAGCDRAKLLHRCLKEKAEEFGFYHE